jgi:hypothetical protein
MLLQSASLSLPGHLAVEPSRGPLFPGFALVTGPSRVADLRGAHYLAIQAHPSLASQVFICSGHRDMLFWSNPTQACLCENCQELLSSLEWVESTDPSVSPSRLNFSSVPRRHFTVQITEMAGCARDDASLAACRLALAPCHSLRKIDARNKLASVSDCPLGSALQEYTATALISSIK